MVVIIAGLLTMFALWQPLEAPPILLSVLLEDRCIVVGDGRARSVIAVDGLVMFAEPR